ncbi:ABC transporter substrate-binding protein [Roseomonas sp. CCTCC AB2023176]|uniref:ABC transporter substrate-binding protein n=1 Tax=Roseomonas sp. CCTCC AB2023176 TaxID=3342640 RepID=UPI0035D8CAA6
MPTLRIAAETVRFLPATRVTDSTGVLTLKNLVLEPLLRWEAGGRMRPGLFARWAHDGTGRRWVFDIRDGATFHDGVPCTSGHVLDFVTGILRSVDMFGMPWSYARYLRDARIAADGPGRVVVENPTPFADVLDVFTEFFPCREDSAGRPWLGTGPYRVAEAENERAAVLQRVRGMGRPGSR